MTLTEAERNEYAVLLSEELDFLEELLTTESMPVEAVRGLMDRRDTIRDKLQVLGYADPDDTAVQGIPLPSDDPGAYSMVPMSSELSDPEDEDPHVPEDEDHAYGPNRANDPELQRCTVCGEPEEAHVELPD